MVPRRPLTWATWARRGAARVNGRAKVLVVPPAGASGSVLKPGVGSAVFEVDGRAGDLGSQAGVEPPGDVGVDEVVPFIGPSELPRDQLVGTQPTGFGYSSSHYRMTRTPTSGPRAAAHPYRSPPRSAEPRRRPCSVGPGVAGVQLRTSRGVGARCLGWCKEARDVDDIVRTVLGASSGVEQGREPPFVIVDETEQLGFLSVEYPARVCDASGVKPQIVNAAQLLASEASERHYWLRNWILEHWPHIVEHAEIARSLATHAEGPDLRPLLDQLAVSGPGDQDDTSAAALLATAARAGQPWVRGLLGTLLPADAIDVDDTTRDVLGRVAVYRHRWHVTHPDPLGLAASTSTQATERAALAEALAAASIDHAEPGRTLEPQQAAHAVDRLADRRNDDLRDGYDPGL